MERLQARKAGGSVTVEGHGITFGYKEDSRRWLASCECGWNAKGPKNPTPKTYATEVSSIASAVHHVKLARDAVKVAAFNDGIRHHVTRLA